MNMATTNDDTPRPRLFAFHFQGWGFDSFFVAAMTEQDAIAGVDRLLDDDRRERISLCERAWESDDKEWAKHIEPWTRWKASRTTSSFEIETFELGQATTSPNN